MFQCFILHVTTSKNVLQMFYAKIFAKMLQNIGKTFLLANRRHYALYKFIYLLTYKPVVIFELSVSVADDSVIVDVTFDEANFACLCAFRC